jgi:hypothetical protein
MPRTCTICTHPRRDEIEANLIAGESFRHIAARFETSTGALQRHKSDHLPAHLIRAKDADEVARADDLLEQVQHLQLSALSILQKAEEGGDLRTALAAIREARGNLELLAKLLGELQQEGTITIHTAPEWLELRAVILAAIQPYPDARAALLEAVSGSARD